jgi:hypothetical protein
MRRAHPSAGSRRRQAFDVLDDLKPWSVEQPFPVGFGDRQRLIIMNCTPRRFRQTEPLLESDHAAVVRHGPTIAEIAAQ